MQLQETNRIGSFNRPKQIILHQSEPLSNITINNHNVIEIDSEYSDPEIEDSDEEYVETEEKELTSTELIISQARNEEILIPISCDLFLSAQKAILPEFRESAVKWAIRINYYFRLTNDVLFNAISYFDILLCHKTITKSEILIYIAVCYWISAKVDTRKQPSVQELNEASGAHFTSQQFIEVEVELLKILHFKLQYPTTKFFMRQQQHEFKAVDDSHVLDMSRFISEVSLLKFQFLDYRYSIIASSITILSFAAFNHISKAIEVATKELQFGTNPDILKNCVSLLKRYSKLMMNDNKNTKSKGIQDMFELSNLDVDVEEIIRLATCNLK